MREPQFENLLKVLNRQRPDRPTLFEFFLNEPLYRKLAGEELSKQYPEWQFGDLNPLIIEAFKNAGYDYATCHGCTMSFNIGEIEMKETISLNAGHAITDRDSFNSYDWPDPDSQDYSRLDKAANWLPDGMKLIVFGPGGILENVISLVGYERLCMMLVDDPALVEDLFANVGQILIRYYEICGQYETVGAMIANDDWGYKTQTMLSPADMRKYVFGWHKKIVETIHNSGRPAILHSCGQLENVMDDVVDEIRYDAKHSYEDTILPVEDAYERWGCRIAILGGIDLDFVCRRSPQEIRQRSQKMLERTAERGGYALGTGNSVPEYVPHENYFALINTILKP